MSAMTIMSAKERWARATPGEAAKKLVTVSVMVDDGEGATALLTFDITGERELADYGAGAWTAKDATANRYDDLLARLAAVKAAAEHNRQHPPAPPERERVTRADADAVAPRVQEDG